MSGMLFYGGLTVLGIASVAGVIMAVILRSARRKLRTRLDAEYGVKRHG
ncbi:hypothetical protein [Paenibacillus sp. MMS20-IR301]|nr:hypothetical protein [Paenibacillus sp. MMS20-IR301]WNS42908.1 hypothetical protein LOS79_28725 [Paenibacillus sp. MMS20-IR301]